MQKIKMLFLCFLCLMVASACKTSSPVGKTTVTTHDSVAVTIDSLSHIALLDSGTVVQTFDITKVWQKDSTATNVSVLDSTFVSEIIETIITNTVDTTGRVLSTDKTTTITRDRDHYRKEQTDTKAERERAEERRLDSLAREWMKGYDSVYSANYDLIESLEGESTVVIQEPKKSWWQRTFDSMVHKFAALMAVLLLLAGVWGAYYYYRRKK